MLAARTTFPNEGGHEGNALHASIRSGGKAAARRAIGAGRGDERAHSTRSASHVEMPATPQRIWRALPRKPKHGRLPRRRGMYSFNYQKVKRSPTQPKVLAKGQRRPSLLAGGQSLIGGDEAAPGASVRGHRPRAIKELSGIKRTARRSPSAR